LSNETVHNLRLILTRSGAELLPLQVTKAEAAKLLGYSVRTVERLVERGELAQIGDGRLARFDLADLKAYQDRNRSRGHHVA
jgi:excisionase family DNA binding protein